jgi:hypothetical protein
MINRKLSRTATAAIAIALSVVLTVLPSYSIKFRPKAILQRPACRQGAATRGACAQTDRSVLKAILPTTNQGYTLADYPTFYWYQPKQAVLKVRFELFTTHNQQPKSLPFYSATFRVKGTRSLASLTLPKSSGLPPLAVNREYLWKITLIDSNGGPDDETVDGFRPSIQGWISRVRSGVGLKKQLMQAKHPYEVYAAEGLWYDAIHDLATRLQKDPQNKQWVSDWNDLLKEVK